MTLARQCLLFAIGSTLFALATVPGFAAAAGAGAANGLCFAGSFFFTSAAWVQLVRSRSGSRAEWLSAATQFMGTLLFNVSTGAAVWAHAVTEQRHLVWAPDATGSVAFLVSGALGIAAVTATAGRFAPRSREWQAQWVNMVGCVAFGASALGAFVTPAGVTEDALLANTGTFLGALCFLAAALLVLPPKRSENPRGRSPRGPL
ncbi:hypothetical protein [Mycolicibacterium monacense]|uniref:YrhK domain-containing protein n=4 Tax=Mycobacteriaceae TaxID=1762 RepID=A0AAD1IXG4_MYCMB|nr:hypothetical protein [Mycolicibacterium monacense]MDA4100692.1 hypothetical protein [Mycolicibacterium monacense DSM 44395]OBB55817.1 hypothetical protein A6B34_07160 [Mycolicibacterium monacense]OBF50918.1 hypothetical protein A5778_18085 [Mycolicibacterium monacense]ORB14860.1 hypothetical protein BST34_22325 [Mycolicibacterium monacense DSM 44395]QHP85620.1 hypothetical protein EWR22_09700 [Mycolicibacterium monacense DSM 44395]